MFGKLFGKQPSLDDVDPEPLYAMLVPVVTDIFTTAREGQAPFAFALTFTGRWDAIGCHMASEAALADVLARNAARREPVDERHFRWVWAEWGTGSFLGDPSAFAPAEAWIAEHIVEPILKRDEQACVAVLLAMTEEILRRADQAGAFGAGAERERALIYPANQDGYLEHWTIEVAGRLNPPATWALHGDDFKSVW
jgi:hypothetical protein